MRNSAEREMGETRSTIIDVTYTHSTRRRFEAQYGEEQRKTKNSEKWVYSLDVIYTLFFFYLIAITVFRKRAWAFLFFFFENRINKTHKKEARTNKEKKKHL